MAQVNLGQYLAAKIRAAIAGALEDEKDTLEAIAKQAGGNVNVNLGGATGSIVGLLSVLGFAAGQPEVAVVLDALGTAESGAGGLGVGFGIGYLLSSLLYPAAQPFLLPVEHATAALVTNEIFDPNTVAALAAAGITGKWNPHSEAAGGGFDSDHLNAMVESEFSYPSWQVGLEMLRRGLIQPTDLTLIMDRGKVPPVYQPQISELQRNLLSPADLALANLRGFMDFPTATAYATRLGITTADFQTLIDNTGEPPGLEVLLDMYRRRIIDQSRLEKGIRESRVRDEWIPYVEAYRFHPMSIADAIRVRVENYFDDATALAITTENGLDPTHYPYLVEAFGRPLSLTEMSSLYHRGLATEADVKQAVRESDIKDKYVDKAFELTRVLLPERQIDLAVEFGALSHEQAIQRLLLLGFNRQDAEVVLTLGEHQHHRIQKDLSAADITASYIDRLMRRPDAVAALERVGYKPDVAEAFLDLAEFKHHSGLAKIAQNEVRALYLKGDIDRQRALHKLTDGGTAREDAEALLDEWDLAHSVPTRHLTAAQIIKAAEYEIYPVGQARAMLRGIGYTDADAHVLLQLAGLLEIPKPTGGVAP